MGACRGKFSLDKLARLAAYRAVDGEGPQAALALGLTVFVNWAV